MMRSIDNPADLEQSLALVADSIESLRESDVYRVLDDCLEESADYMDQMATYIIESRPDLANEVNDALQELESHCT